MQNGHTRGISLVDNWRNDTGFTSQFSLKEIRAKDTLISMHVRNTSQYILALSTNQMKAFQTVLILIY